MISDTEHLFICILAICIWFSEISESFAQFYLIKKKFIYLFSHFWLRRVLVVACRIFYCGTRALHSGAWAQERVGSVVWGTAGFLVEVRGLSCPVACGILVPRPGNRTRIPCIGRWILYHWTTREFPAQFYFSYFFWIFEFYFIYMFIQQVLISYLFYIY